MYRYINRELGAKSGQRCWNRAAQYSYLYLQNNEVRMLPWSQCMRVWCKYYSDLTLRARRFVAKAWLKLEVLQFKVTVWSAKVAPDRARKLKNSKIFWGSTPPPPPPPPDLPSCLCISVLQAAESWAGPGYEAARKRSVLMLCPGIGCALATPLLRSNLIALNFKIFLGEHAPGPPKV